MRRQDRPAQFQRDRHEETTSGDHPSGGSTEPMIARRLSVGRCDYGHGTDALRSDWALAKQGHHQRIEAAARITSAMTDVPYVDETKWLLAMQIRRSR